jgi:DNA adenine methylase
MGTAVSDKPVQQAFGSPGGKTYLAERIVGVMPPHDVYTESFAGGAAVYFKKPRSDKEVLSDKDAEIAFAFRFLRDMTQEQYARLKRFDWRVSRDTFDRLKASHPKDDVERFRRFYYLKKGSYGHGGTSVNPECERKDTVIGGIDRLWKVKERLQRTAVHGGDAIAVIRKYDSPTTLHFIDPPYPGRAFVGAQEKYTEADLARLVTVLKDIRGKFILTLGTEHARLLPKTWHIKRVAVRRTLTTRYTGGNPIQYEIVVTNYNPDTVIRRLSDRVLHRERPSPSSLPVGRLPFVVRRPSRRMAGRRSRHIRGGHYTLPTLSAGRL